MSKEIKIQTCYFDQKLRYNLTGCSQNKWEQKHELAQSLIGVNISGYAYFAKRVADQVKRLFDWMENIVELSSIGLSFEAAQEMRANEWQIEAVYKVLDKKRKSENEAVYINQPNHQTVWTNIEAKNFPWTMVNK